MIRYNYNRSGWLGRITIVLAIAWLVTIIISINYIFKENPVQSPEIDKDLNEDNEQFIQIMRNLKILKQQNSILRKIILRNSLGYIQGNHLGNTIHSVQKDSVYYDLIDQHDNINANYNEPSLQYENIRRQIINGVQEMWYFMNSELTKLKKDCTKYNLPNKLETILENFAEHKKYLTINTNKLAVIDGFSKWREKEARELSYIVQRRFKYLQNPVDCNAAKKLVCNLNKGCGFGCQVHHLVYCFLVAYGTERTLILKSKGWRYQKEGWESVFKPLSDTCISAKGHTYANWPGDQTKQVLTLPIIDNVYPKPIFQPPSVPTDLLGRLEKIHGYPLVWWVGQVLKYLMRPNGNTKSLLESKMKAIKFINPVVGVHIRRTDKVGTEAAFHEVDEYMLNVQQYFSSLDVQPNIKRVFLASDDPKVIITAKQRYPDFEFIADTDVAQTASISRRYSDLSLQGIITDIHFLSLCDYLVCTFSSQVCRVAYELMQTYHPDAHNRFTSLDDIYYYGGQNPHPHSAIIDHTPKGDGEIELKINDKIEVFGNHWDGYSKGRNLRTGLSGLFPSFKVQNSVKSVIFPKYENVY